MALVLELDAQTATIGCVIVARRYNIVKGKLELLYSRSSEFYSNNKLEYHRIVDEI